MRIVLLKEIPEDAQLRQQWDELVLGEPSPQVFYTYEWALAVQRAYDALQPLIFLGYTEAGSLDALVALATDKVTSRVTFLCATTADYCDVLGRREAKANFLSAVVRELAHHGFKHITLTNLPSDSATLAIRGSISQEVGYHIFARTAYDCAQISLEALRKVPGENNRLPGAKRLRRSVNALKRESVVFFDHLRSWKDAESVLPQYIEAHVARFLATGRISNLAAPERQNFLRELGGLLSESGWLVLSRMTADTATLAWNYGFSFQGTWFWYQPALQSGFEKYSPGFCLLSKIVEDAIATPDTHTVDLGLGAEEYKDSFANQTRRTMYVTLRGSLAHHAWEIFRYRSSQVAKVFPPVERALRIIVRHLQRHDIISIFRKLGRQVRDYFYSETEVFFYEVPTSDVETPPNIRLVPIDLNCLARAAMQYVKDGATCTYLLRAAKRLRGNQATAFALLAPDGTFLHFAWTTAFDGFFLSELGSKVKTPFSDCVMLFDCWTPLVHRGHGYYGQAVSAIANLEKERGKKVWIFSAVSNSSSVRGLAKARVQFRYSLVARRIFGWRQIRKNIPASSELVPRGASVGV